MSFSILGTGMYVPERVVTNDELAGLVDTSDEWIMKRVGVRQRHVCTDQTAADLAYHAAVRALENSGCQPDELDLILAATVSGETVSPSVSCLVQQRLGAACMAFDLNAACSAFLFLLDVAAGYFARGKAKKVLVIGAERMSRIVDWTDRSTCVIFGDGAGAAVLGEGDDYLCSTFTVQGGEEVIKIPQFAGKSPFYQKEPDAPYIFMNGQETFKYAVKSICQDVPALLRELGLTADDLAYIIPHQANKRIIDFASRQCGIPKEKFYLNIDRFGNTSSASVPMALDELNRSGKLHQGDRLLLTAFGGGLAHASCIIRWAC